MAEKKVIELEVKTNTASLKAQLREAQNEVQALSEKFGAASKEAVNAAKKAAELKDAIGDAKALTDAFNPDAKFNSLSKSISGVLNGFQAFEGALALVGVESEDVQKTLLKVQGAMALTEGINGVLEAKDAFKILKIAAVDALKGIRTGILATGIGIFVVALGTIVAYWDEIKASVSGVSEEQKKLNANSQSNLDIQKAKLTAIGAQENILKLQGKSEKYILDLKIAQSNKAIEAAETQIKNNATTALAQIEASKRNKEILSGILQYISLPISLLLRTVDSIGKALGKDFGLNDKLFGGLANLVFDPKETAKEIAAVKKQQTDALIELKNNKAGFELAIKAIDKTAAETAATNRKTASDKIAEDERKEREAKLKALEDFANDTEAIAKKRREKESEEQKKAADNELKIQSDKLLAQAELDKKNAEDKKALDAQAIVDKKRTSDAIFQITRQSFDVIGNLAVAFAGKSEKEQKKAFEIQKAANIAGALMDTWKAASGAYASLASIPVVGPVLGGIAAGVATAAGLANVKNISSQQFGSRGNISAPNNMDGGGQANQVITPNFNIIGNQNQTQLAQLNQPPIKAYVVGSDVTTQQMLDKKKVQNATL
jgi:hypothetical protein